MTRNARTALLASIAAVSMTGLGWASVPLYRMFCQVTGLNGTTQRGDLAPGGIGDKVTVRFDSNVAPDLQWRFRPERASETIDIGARDMAFFTAKNMSNRPITGTATFNVTPTQAGKYFTKIQCFCFTEQTLQPGEEVRMPVIFYVDPELASDPDTSDVRAITLSYTFYPVDSARTPS
ncbi:cytochrome c oxidase assembly protein [Sphingomonas sp. 3-13AW]|jgi:cytochrome c oxidase assembly protein subunit 11|uniref:cytochrome c oxidase assembly protein n=1 Tax=Sphingomonas sp. 3-13AW TaxID=3050450 RepID=UPI003BB7A81B